MLSRSALLVYFPLQELLDSDADSGVRVVRLHTSVSISKPTIIVPPWPILQYLHSQRLRRVASAICRVCLHTGRRLIVRT
jgi:hypothetical protein